MEGEREGERERGLRDAAGDADAADVLRAAARGGEGPGACAVAGEGVVLQHAGPLHAPPRLHQYNEEEDEDGDEDEDEDEDRTIKQQIAAPA